jgi:hypothetical protein
MCLTTEQRRVLESIEAGWELRKRLDLETREHHWWLVRPGSRAVVDGGDVTVVFLHEHGFLDGSKISPAGRTALESS